MQLPGSLLFWSTATATVAALSLGPSFAHVLESAPRLARWSPDLWRETTVFNAQFWLFAAVGAPLDVAAILFPAILAWLVRSDSPAFGYAVAAAVLYLLALVVWYFWVQEANSIMATWTAAAIPQDFEAVRLRWETGHMAVAAIKLGGFVALVLSLLSIGRIGI